MVMFGKACPNNLPMGRWIDLKYSAGGSAERTRLECAGEKERSSPFGHGLFCITYCTCAETF